MEVRGQPAVLSSLLSPGRFWDPNSGLQTWQQEPLPLVSHLIGPTKVVLQVAFSECLLLQQLQRASAGWDETQLVECLPSISTRPGAPSPALQKPGLVAQDYNPSPWEVAAEGTEEIQGQRWLQ